MRLLLSFWLSLIIEVFLHFLVVQGFGKRLLMSNSKLYLQLLYRAKDAMMNPRITYFCIGIWLHLYGIGYFNAWIFVGWLDLWGFVRKKMARAFYNRYFSGCLTWVKAWILEVWSHWLLGEFWFLINLSSIVQLVTLLMRNIKNTPSFP